MNQVILIGRLTKDIEIKYTTTDPQKAYCQFSLAINNGKDKNGNEIKPDYPPITAWGKTAELCDKYLKKGDLIGVEGSIKTGAYEKDGKKVFTVNVQASRVEFLHLKDKEETKEEKQETMTGFSQIADDDIPF